MTTTTRSRDIFDFFGLARELREMIYNDPLTDKEIGDLSGDALGIFFTATHIPRTNLLLVSQQFSAEYQAASNELATLIVGDKMCEVYDEPVQMNLPDQLRSTHKLRLNLYL
ncbi:hypothetical protein B0A55_04203 [Friedmanniomyces simplex]|uniref:Uncharacterized protein n=1 Tax=Friedmanniomyces simplex TaxID=329884 RepID=A0A4U0XH36_9PEZI|nr:hypothetical protein B0A55_04203 [Friedmanniomyces simplex]